ncbi:hypothetical protein [Paenibacillus sambharensis]|nr:hypothetical protein [Paenibacillus sambharensis]
MTFIREVILLNPRVVFILLAHLTSNGVLRKKYLTNYKRQLHRDWGWTA